jgi:hypothetical protein
MRVECAESSTQPAQNEVQALVRIERMTRRMLASWFDIKDRTTTAAEGKSFARFHEFGMD